jgi:hypothetical protein
MENPKSKLLTFESWVTNQDWYHCAVTRSNRIPLIFLDRSVAKIHRPDDMRPAQ